MLKKLLSPLWITMALIITGVFGFLFWHTWSADHMAFIPWSSYTSPTGDFRIFIPGIPNISTIHGVTDTGVPSTTQIYTTSDEESTYEVNKYTYDKPIFTRDLETQMRTVIEQSVKSTNGTLVSSNYHILNSRPSTDFLIKIQDQYVQGRLIIVNSTTEYYLAHNYTPGNDDVAMSSIFINSLEIHN